MADAEIQADDAILVTGFEPRSGRRRLRSPLRQTIDLFFVDPDRDRSGAEAPVYDRQGQPSAKPKSPGSILSAIA